MPSQNNRKHDLKLHYGSAATGVNVVEMFQSAIEAGVAYLRYPDKQDTVQQVLEFLREDAARNPPPKTPRPAKTEPSPRPRRRRRRQEGGAGDESVHKASRSSLRIFC
ncbi:rab11B GTPase [Diplonema papillatum]|nr:rab11B GTPase [Diplonema papillatum]KAJ9461947.1 rab11B GTPase [Diplonema papillatum]